MSDCNIKLAQNCIPSLYFKTVHVDNDHLSQLNRVYTFSSSLLRALVSTEKRELTINLVCI